MTLVCPDLNLFKKILISWLFMTHFNEDCLADKKKGRTFAP